MQLVGLVWYKRNNMNKICIISDEYPPIVAGGAGAIAAEQAEGLVAQGYTVTVITRCAQAQDEGVIQYNGVRVIRIHSSYPNIFRQWVGVLNLSMLIKANNVLRKEAPDLIHIHNIHTYFSFAICYLSQKIAPTFFTAHDAMTVSSTKVSHAHKITVREKLSFARFSWNPFRESFIRCLIRNVKISTVSNALKQVLEMNNVVVDTVIHNGIDVNKFNQANINLDLVKDLNKEFLLSEDTRYILFGGRASAAKGVYVAMQAMPEIRRKFPQTQLLLVGVPLAEQEKLNNFAQSNSLVGTFKCINWLPRERMPLVYARSSAVVVPSQYIDPLPTVIIEAMASGVPVVATNRGGAAELVSDEFGYVGNPDSTFIAQSIIEILNNPAGAEQKVHRAQERALRLFSRSAFIQRVVSWYDKYK